jgi:hypothetical protein
MSDGFVKVGRGEATWELLAGRNAFVLLTVIALRARSTHSWSRGKVTRFLNTLENAQQIVQQKDNVTTVITTTSWKPCQKTDGKQYSRRTASGPQADTNKNEKNEENEKKSSCNASALRVSELLFGINCPAPSEPRSLGA